MARSINRGTVRLLILDNLVDLCFEPSCVE